MGGSTENKTPKQKSSKKNPHSENNRLLEDLRNDKDKAKELAYQIQLEIEDAKIEAMQDGYLKQIAIIDQQEKRKLFEIDKKKITDNEFKTLDEKIAKAKGADKQLFIELRKSWEKNNADLETLKASQTEIYELKRQEAEHKYYADDIKRQENNEQTTHRHIQPTGQTSTSSQPVS